MTESTKAVLAAFWSFRLIFALSGVSGCINEDVQSKRQEELDFAIKILIFNASFL
jgi:hypothetical protein